MMAKVSREFGYGDPLADVGTEGWAKRTRIILLSKVDGTKFSVHDLKCHLDRFFFHHGWRLLDNKDGKPFVHFRQFVETEKPWGLGTNYDSFRALIASEIGEREFDRLTASEAQQGKRADLTSSGQRMKSGHDRTAKLRAINRAPAEIQRLYDRDLLAVDVAAKFGPLIRGDDAGEKSQLEQRAKALQERVESLQVFRPDLAGRKLKREVNQAAREILSLKPPSKVDAAWRIVLQMNKRERDEFLKRLHEEGW